MSSTILLIGADTLRARAYAAAIEHAGLGPVSGLFYGPDGSAQGALPGEGRTLGELWLPRFGDSVFTIFERNGWPYRRLAAEKINDPACVAALRKSGAGLAIFAGRGGEIVSAEVLDQSVPVLHMHPGKLPEQRGSTTLYYSILEDRPCSVSALLMSAEIDAGPVVALNSYPLPPPDVDVDMVYDCAVRADTLLDVLLHLRQYGELPHVTRATGEDQLYFVVHPLLKHLALLSLQRGQTGAAVDRMPSDDRSNIQE